jgi:hypothetical protein
LALVSLASIPALIIDQLHHLVEDGDAGHDAKRAADGGFSLPKLVVRFVTFASIGLALQRRQ